MFMNDRTVAEIARNMESLVRDHSRAQSTLTQTKASLAEFVLANSELFAQGDPLDLSAYEVTIREAEWTIKWSQEEFEQEKTRLASRLAQLSISH